ncbi:uncharacterized protein LOC135131515 [Zophobas morio]|uniref:uncharacterized protein LOC135131515 n=1 Tax=Zophobas morio TaxID=2755281 RepID=UPI003083A9BA
MVVIKISTLLLLTTVLNKCLANPGHHVHHRIHIPTKIKTIFHTKIIKIPEHHHYIHEKEKPHLVKVPEHHHYFHEKEKENLDVNDWDNKDDDIDTHSDWESDHRGSYGHNIFKKHVSTTPRRRHKKRKH